MPDWTTDPLTWWTLFAFALGYGLGLGTERLLAWIERLGVIPPGPGNHTPGNHTDGERELAITQDPDAWPIGHDWMQLSRTPAGWTQAEAPDSLHGGHYTITRHEDLGSISVIGQGRVQQWRIWGRPA